MTTPGSASAVDTLAPGVAALPAAPGWAWGAREAALASFRASGLPTSAEELWRVTELGGLEAVPFGVARERATGCEDALGGALAGILSERAGAVLVVGNGRLVGKPRLPEGVSVVPFGDASDEARRIVERLMARDAGRRWFAPLNAAMFGEGLFLDVSAGCAVTEPITLLYVSDNGPSPLVSYPRVTVRAQRGSRLTLVEEMIGTASESKRLCNAATDVLVQADARVDHVRVHDAGATGAIVGGLDVSVGRGAHYASRIVTLGGALSRCDANVTLEGEGASTTLDGAYHAGGDDVVDHHTCIEHRARRTTSREVYRGIAVGKGHVVFDGTIFVRPGSHGTEASQENRNLLLSRDAVVHTKPHLEIEVDDVKCSHGATVGALDPDELFYLRTRGISEVDAIAILTYSFVRPLLEAIPVSDLAARVARRFFARMHVDAGDLGFETEARR